MHKFMFMSRINEIRMNSCIHFHELINSSSGQFNQAALMLIHS
jgi:hypothetical protein